MSRRKSRPVQWAEACDAARAALETLVELQEDYQEWLDNLPDGLDMSPTAEKLDTVCDIELTDALAVVEEAEGADLPRGFGRD